MNWDRIAGEWKQLKGRIQSKWAKLSDDDLAAAGAKKESLVGKIQERYGVLRDEAERQVDEWIAKLGEKRENEPVEPPPKAAPRAEGADRPRPEPPRR